MRGTGVPSSSPGGGEGGDGVGHGCALLRVWGSGAPRKGVAGRPGGHASLRSRRGDSMLDKVMMIWYLCSRKRSRPPAKPAEIGCGWRRTRARSPDVHSGRIGEHHHAQANPRAIPAARRLLGGPPPWLEVEPALPVRRAGGGVPGGRARHRALSGPVLPHRGTLGIRRPHRCPGVGRALDSVAPPVRGGPGRGRRGRPRPADVLPGPQLGAARAPPGFRASSWCSCCTSAAGRAT